MVKSIAPGLSAALAVVAVALPAWAQVPVYTEPGSTRMRNPGIQAPPTAHEVDLDYCRRLSSIYLRYVGVDDGSDKFAKRNSDLEGRVAVAKCNEGDAAAAIPILERKLVNNGFTLPERG